MQSVFEETNREIILIPGIALNCATLPAAGIDSLWCSGSGRFSASERAWSAFGDLVDRAGIPRDRVRAFNYSTGWKTPDVGGSGPRDWYFADDTRQSLSRSASLLGDQIDYWGTEGKSYTIIAHSLGGAVAALWAATEDRPRVRRAVHSVITFDSPLNGLDSATVAPWYPAAGEPVGNELLLNDARNTSNALELIAGAPDEIDIFTFANVHDAFVPDRAALMARGCPQPPRSDSQPDPGIPVGTVQLGPSGLTRVCYAAIGTPLYDALQDPAQWQEVLVNHASILHDDFAAGNVRQILHERTALWASRWYYTPMDGVFVKGCGAPWHAIINGAKRAVPDVETYRLWGGPAEETFESGVEVLAPAQCAAIPNGAAIASMSPPAVGDYPFCGPVVQDQLVQGDDAGIYVGEGGTYRLIPDQETLNTPAFSGKPIQRIDGSCLWQARATNPLPSARGQQRSGGDAQAGPRGPSSGGSGQGQPQASRRQTPGRLTFRATDTDVSVGDEVWLTATTERSLDGTGYIVTLHDADAMIQRCTSGSTCRVKVGSDNPDSQEYRAQIEDTDNDGEVVARASGVTVSWTRSNSSPSTQATNSSGGGRTSTNTSTQSAGSASSSSGSQPARTGTTATSCTTSIEPSATEARVGGSITLTINTTCTFTGDERLELYELLGQLAVPNNYSGDAACEPRSGTRRVCRVTKPTPGTRTYFAGVGRGPDIGGTNRAQSSTVVLTWR